MIAKLLIAWCLMAVCVVVHAVGIAVALRWIRNRQEPPPRFREWTGRFIWIAGWIILLHLLEIAAWAGVYAVGGALPEISAAVYFSAVTYTTTGYGDLLLPEAWRLVGGVEALTGILMCGWSTAFFFAVVSRMYEGRTTPSAGAATGEALGQSE
ncbi:MAG: two pore domain potassium channel family protein [Verrucomicrobiales bacterium]|nr:two pore domain potassium channel family protein [Verrucomicrobiales bacterium]MCP5526164.1 two pore domain potassium channel family protein [Verrucomicrobiales bacterium]